MSKLQEFLVVAFVSCIGICLALSLAFALTPVKRVEPLEAYSTQNNTKTRSIEESTAPDKETHFVITETPRFVITKTPDIVHVYPFKGKNYYLLTDEEAMQIGKLPRAEVIDLGEKEMNKDIKDKLKAAVVIVPLGKYAHFKSGVYEVYSHSIYVTDDALYTMVHYRNDEGDCYSRRIEDFIQELDNHIYEYHSKSATYSGPRFTLIDKLDSQVELLRATIDLNKKFWDEQKEINPAFTISGGGHSLKYVVADKIHFAMTLRIIDKMEAQKLLEEIKSWS